MSALTIADIVCQWFARCDQPSAGVVSHPALDYVPTCQRCADRLGLTFAEGVEIEVTG